MAFHRKVELAFFFLFQYNKTLENSDFLNDKFESVHTNLNFKLP